MQHRSESDDFTQLLKCAQLGDARAEERFCERVNDELHRLARALVRKGNHEIAQPISLVNELFLRVFRRGVVNDLVNRRYFFAVAIDQMRQILRERFRRRRSQRQGGHLTRRPLDVVLDQYLDDFESQNRLDFLALDEALERLRRGAATRRQYEIIKLYYLAGFQQTEIAELMEVDTSTVRRDLKAGKAKLAVELKGDSK